MPVARPLSRRQLLFGGQPGTPALRPPWALDERAFLAACTQCRACVERCPQQVLVLHRDGYPRFDPVAGECTFCGDCVDACQSGALQMRNGQPAWQQIAEVGEACLCRSGVVCGSCREICPESALHFERGRIAAPRVDADRCSGCGACVSVCPSAALSVRAQVQEAIA
ncbi:ferredoxin-type protein NapF [Pseudoxanthomonas dokdonensis]|uniref:4Fe-4S ferredoxin-type domain-containing protein n=1 Tax=Pseudoxanthomonas dokdonensis TaxID=344882 RepID=A0A0R0D0H0_9GAMM|nr:ferredoxin-type protein NapF [Pseudoxanthomonas dokdonensis]KRG71524.1 hypothetical protein ABB29_01760 [Pseudoxanthomonas dokdonensis]